MFIRIRADNGFPECATCKHIESLECASCDEGERYELDPEFEDRLKAQSDRELLAA